MFGREQVAAAARRMGETFTQLAETLAYNQPAYLFAGWTPAGHDVPLPDGGIYMASRTKHAPMWKALDITPLVRVYSSLDAGLIEAALCCEPHVEESESTARCSGSCGAMGDDPDCPVHGER